MSMTLRPSVQTTCAEEIAKDENKANCNVFLKAVCEKQYIFLPTSNVGIKDTSKSGTANDLMQGFVDYSLMLSTMFTFLGRGSEGAVHAVALAKVGKLVICGLTSTELNQETSRKKEGAVTLHGHVAVLTGEFGANAWPMAYWGMHKKPKEAGTPASLSLCFRRGDQPKLAYYAYA